MRIFRCNDGMGVSPQRNPSADSASSALSFSLLGELQLNLLDHTDPVTVIEIPIGELRYKRKHLIRKSTDA